MTTKLNPIALAAILGASVGVAEAQASDPPREREDARSEERESRTPSRQYKIESPSRQYKLEDAASSRQLKIESAPSRQLKIEAPSRQAKITDRPSRQIKIDGVDGEAAERPDPRADRPQRRPQ